MLDRIAVSTLNFPCVIKSKLKNRNGMEMLQMVIIIAIAVAMAALFYAVFKMFVGEDTSSGFWGTLTDKVTNLFGE